MASLRAELDRLREAMASLQAARPPKAAAMIDAEKAAAAVDAAKQKRIEERELARREHAEFLAKQEAAKQRRTSRSLSGRPRKQ